MKIKRNIFFNIILGSILFIWSFNGYGQQENNPHKFNAAKIGRAWGRERGLRLL